MLKTLKDLMEENDWFRNYEADLLKQEAIKHIKAIDYESEGGFELKDWIMYFFNISEEELKC